MPSDSSSGVAARPSRSRFDDPRLEQAVNLVFWTLVALLVGFVLFFGYTVYADRQEQLASNPARRAIEQVKLQVRENPNNATLRVQLAEAFVAAKMMDEAIEQLNAALEIDPDFVTAYMDLAIVSLMEQDTAAAESYLYKVLELTAASEYAQLDDRREAAFYYLGEIALEQQRYEDAIGFFKESARLRRDASDTYLRLGQAYVGLGELDTALDELRKSLAFDPYFAEAHYEAGLVYLQLDNPSSAAEHFRDALEQVPENELALEALESIGEYDEWFPQAKAALEEGDFRAASDAARVAHALDPQSIEAYLVLAKAYDELGQVNAAIEAYEGVLDLDASNDEAKRALARLGDGSGAEQ